MYQDAEPRMRNYDFFGVIKRKVEEDSFSGELQNLFRTEHFNIVAGAGHFYIKQKDIDYTELFLPPFGASTVITRSHINHTNLYLYSQINYPKNLTLTIGGSADFVNDAKGTLLDRNQFNPKFGVTYNPFEYHAAGLPCSGRWQ
jgi:hypothetical protein